MLNKHVNIKYKNKNINNKTHNILFTINKTLYIIENVFFPV